MEAPMSSREIAKAISVDWETAARVQGYACYVCKEAPTERDREEYFATGLCLECARTIMTPRSEVAGEPLEL
jgi:hypothetical protein